MALDYYDLSSLKKNHPAWRLMTADNSPLIAGFLDRAFRMENRRSIGENDLTMALEDYLYQLRESERTGGNPDAFPREARVYLDEWARSDRGWLRKFYPPGSDEAHYDLTPATETALQWLEGLFDRGFVGTESRLHTTVQLLREIVNGVEEDKEKRLKELSRRREALNAEIKAVKSGEIPMLDNRELRERFIQFSRMARELLSDFRAVEHNFRELDRSIREQIAAWTGEKSGMLKRFFGEHDAITQSDQGESFRAFWDFLMSPSSQEELTELLDRVFSLDELGEERRDDRLRRIHFDWMTAGEQTQRTVARLSQQLRSYLDDRAYYENRRIIQLHGSIEKKALEIRESPPGGTVMELDDWRPLLSLPLERPLFVPPLPAEIAPLEETAEEIEIDTSALFDIIVVDKTRLRQQIEEMLLHRTQVTLPELLESYPLQEGLAELVGYYSVASEADNRRFRSLIDEEKREIVSWVDKNGVKRRGRVPGLLFVAGGSGHNDGEKETTSKEQTQ